MSYAWSYFLCDISGHVLYFDEKFFSRDIVSTHLTKKELARYILLTGGIFSQNHQEPYHFSQDDLLIYVFPYEIKNQRVYSCVITPQSPKSTKNYLLMAFLLFEKFLGLSPDLFHLLLDELTSLSSQSADAGTFTNTMGEDAEQEYENWLSEHNFYEFIIQFEDQVLKMLPQNPMANFAALLSEYSQLHPFTKDPYAYGFRIYYNYKKPDDNIGLALLYSKLFYSSSSLPTVRDEIFSSLVYHELSKDLKPISLSFKTPNSSIFIEQTQDNNEQKSLVLGIYQHHSPPLPTSLLVLISINEKLSALVYLPWSCLEESLVDKLEITTSEVTTLEFKNLHHSVYQKEIISKFTPSPNCSAFDRILNMTQRTGIRISELVSLTPEKYYSLACESVTT